MKKKIALFFLFHFIIIATLSVYLVIDSFVDVHYQKKSNIPVIGFLKDNVYDSKYFRNYLILSGINTGYGFYGISVSTEKYLEIDLYDSARQIIKKDNYFNFSTTSGFSRFKGYASHLANYINDTNEFLQKDNSEETKLNTAIREKYIEKVFKWLGKDIAASTPGCAYYKIKLNTVIPVNVWKQKENEKLLIYVIKEIEFPAKQDHAHI